MLSAASTHSQKKETKSRPNPGSIVSDSHHQLAGICLSLLTKAQSLFVMCCRVESAAGHRQVEAVDRLPEEGHDLTAGSLYRSLRGRSHAQSSDRSFQSLLPG